jgi:hypothetical protein
MTVVVGLGQRLTGESLHPHLRRRVDRAVDVFRRADRSADAKAWLVFTGARTNPDVPVAESEAMAEHAVTAGVDPDRIRLDANARDTRENGYFVRRLVDELVDQQGDARETIHVVSSCIHARRAVDVFEHSFGPGCEIDVADCVEGEADDPAVAITPDGVERDRRADREFFDPVTPGDLGELYERFRRSDEYPDWAARVDPPTA